MEKGKKRKICAKCGAKKYEKYLTKKLDMHGFIKKGWFCKNTDKCKHRGANYKK